ncbi:hypothetical protein [Sphaerospermopsis torques-reginae]|uniref:hypothetical protein n=1 Tax=Sphaerospermopsis torques-reginae TaxID=984207 RepID=UPI00349E6807
MYLLDTDTLTHLHAGNINVVKQLNFVDDDIIAITIITKIEVLRGIKLIMKKRPGILLLTLVIPGFSVVLISLYFFVLDYSALIKAENYVEQLAKDKTANERSLQFAYHRALAHRINVFADATWGLLGGVITAIGIHGLVILKEKE